MKQGKNSRFCWFKIQNVHKIDNDDKKNILKSKPYQRSVIRHCIMHRD